MLTKKVKKYKYRIILMRYANGTTLFYLHLKRWFGWKLIPRNYTYKYFANRDEAYKYAIQYTNTQLRANQVVEVTVIEQFEL